MKTSYEIDLPESNYLYIAKKYGWTEFTFEDGKEVRNHITYIDFARNWFMIEIIQPGLANAFFEAETSKMHELEIQIRQTATQAAVCITAVE